MFSWCLGGDWLAALGANLTHGRTIKQVSTTIGAMIVPQIPNYGAI
jgi:hypothetical protein